MPTSCTHVYVHFVWAAWDRMPLITAALEPRLFACLAAKCLEMKCELVAINGTEDHVHALVRLHSTVSVAEAVKGMKGTSSHFITHELQPQDGFKWQGTYGAFSVSRQELEPVLAYIEHQKEHHARRSLIGDWERCTDDSATC